MRKQTPTHPVCMKKLLLWNIRLCRTSRNRSFLLAGNQPSISPLVGQLRNTAHKITMILGIIYTLPDQIHHVASVTNLDIGHTRVTVSNIYGFIRVGTRMAIHIIIYTVIIIITIAGIAFTIPVAVFLTRIRHRRAIVLIIRDTISIYITRNTRGPSHSPDNQLHKGYRFL